MADPHPSYNRYRDPEGHKEYKRLWHLKNKERLNKVSREHYYKNRDKVLSRQKEQRTELTLKERERYHSDPEFRRRKLARTHARLWNIIPEELEEFKNMYRQKCFYCDNNGGSIDHLIPQSRGGADRLYNLVPCCKSCNSSKNNKTPGEWYDAGGSTIR